MGEVIKPLLPVRDLRNGGGPRIYHDRVALNAIFYVLCSGCPWRMLPHDLMPFDAAHRWLTPWPRNGTWDKVHHELPRQVRIRAGRQAEPTAAIWTPHRSKAAKAASRSASIRPRRRPAVQAT